MARPFAAFDIDGTVIRWQLYHAMADKLAQREAIDAAAFDGVKIARMNWKRREDSEGFRQYEAALVKVFDQALIGIPVETFELAAESVFEEYKDQVYTYTRDLIQDLKSKHYLLFAISGSPNSIIKKLAHYYGFDDYAATNYPIENGRFLGTKDLSIGKKPQLLAELVKKHQAGEQGSVAVGDSEGDIDMLAMVEQPIAFNPSQILFKHARANNWKIVVERKNVVYELEPGDGSYLLA